MASYSSDWASAFSCSPLNVLSNLRVRHTFLTYPTKGASTDQFDSAEVEQPELVMIIGCVGFGLNLISVMFLHGASSCFSCIVWVIDLWAVTEHDHGDGHGHGHEHDHDYDHSENAQESGRVTNTNPTGLSNGKVCLSPNTLTPIK